MDKCYYCGRKLGKTSYYRDNKEQLYCSTVCLILDNHDSGKEEFDIPEEASCDLLLEEMVRFPRYYK